MGVALSINDLDIHEARQLSRVVDVLGTPAAPDELASCIDVLEALVDLYRKELVRANQASRNHGE